MIDHSQKIDRRIAELGRTIKSLEEELKTHKAIIKTLETDLWEKSKYILYLEELKGGV